LAQRRNRCGLRVSLRSPRSRSGPVPARTEAAGGGPTNVMTKPRGELARARRRRTLLDWVPCRTFLLLLAGLAALSFCSVGVTAPLLREFQPRWLANGQPYPVASGRVMAVTVNPKDGDRAIAASFSGGLFKTQNGGRRWRHLDGFVPNRPWDVAYDPVTPNVVIATVQVDTHVRSGVGIWRSRDGGQTWTHTGINGPCGRVPGRDISFGPHQNVFVATDCGIARSRSGGSTWRFPSGVPQAWSVVSQPGPGYPANPTSVIVDACGSGGIYRSTDGGATWALRPPPPFGLFTCSLARSPFERDVLFAASGAQAWESDDAGVAWTKVADIGFNPGRRPFVRTQRTPGGPPGAFTLFFNPGADLKRLSCASGGPSSRCGGAPIPAFAGHHDPGDIEFRSTPPGVGCPWLETNDGGVYRSVDCGLTWKPAFVGFGALQIYDLAGTVHRGSHTDLYLGTMDNELWASPNGGVTWPNHVGSEGFFLEAPHATPADGQTVVGQRCAFSPPFPPCPTFFANGSNGGSHFEAGDNVPFWVDPPGGRGVAYALAPEKFVEVAGNSVYVGISGSWPVSAPLPSGLSLSTEGFVGGGTAYFVNSPPGGRASLVRVSGLLGPTPAVTATNVGPGDLDFWTPDDIPWIQPHVMGVDPSNPMHVIAADRMTRTMKVSTDGGISWQTDAALTRLVTDNGRLTFDNPFVNSQAHVIAFDPVNAKRIVVGTEASGILASRDGGATWFRVPQSRRVPAISDFFFDELGGSLIVSTYGRGLWKLDLAKLEPPKCARLREQIAEATAEIADLQADLQHAAPGEKRAIVRQIRTWQAKRKAATHEAKALGCRL
jgi:photosystem II stability/assembly factor-like uncharacterized protein